MTAIRAGGPDSGEFARITASRAACSTATHTVEEIAAEIADVVRLPNAA